MISFCGSEHGPYICIWRKVEWDREVVGQIGQKTRVSSIQTSEARDKALYFYFIPFWFFSPKYSTLSYDIYISPFLPEDMTEYSRMHTGF
jgi:hypothetical protein